MKMKEKEEAFLPSSLLSAVKATKAGSDIPKPKLTNNNPDIIRNSGSAIRAARRPNRKQPHRRRRWSGL